MGTNRSRAALAAFALALLTLQVATVFLAQSPATGAPLQLNRFRFPILVTARATEPALMLQNSGSGQVLRVMQVPTVTGTPGTPGTPVAVAWIGRDGQLMLVKAAVTITPTPTNTPTNTPTPTPTP